MEEAKITEENAYPLNPFLSPEGSFSAKSSAFPDIAQEDGGNQLHGEPEKDDEILLLFNSPNTPILDQGGFVASDQNNSGIKLEDPKVAVDEPKEAETPKEVETPKNENGVSESLKKDDMHRMLIDTAAPFESVRAAVTKFGGIVEGKAEETLNIERQRQLQLEIKKVQEEILRYQKHYEATKIIEEQVLKELDYSKSLVEELKHKVEMAETQEAQAKQDSELADLRLKEMDEGITDSESLATKAQLEVAKERHARAIAELQSVKQELETVRREYVSLAHERDVAIMKAVDSISASEEIEMTIKDLMLQLITTKELVESAHSEHLKAEEQIIGAALSLELEKLIWEKELKQTEGELQELNDKIQMTNDVKTKLDRASTLLVNLKAELASYIQASSATSPQELEEVRANVEKTNDSLNSFGAAVSTLKSELEMEKTSMATIMQREALASLSVPCLEAELSNITAELEQILVTEKEAREKMAGLPNALQQASEEAEQAKLLANMAREELRKAKEEAEQAKVGASIMEMRLNAAFEEIKAAKASEKLASSKIKALQESKQASMECGESSKGVTLSRDEYCELSKKADEAEELAKERVISATKQIKAAMESETSSLQELKEANKALEERKKALRDATEKAEKTEEEKLEVEKELQILKTEREHQKKINATRSLPDFSNFDATDETETVSEADVETYQSAIASPDVYEVRSNTANAAPAAEPKRRKRLFFARIVMFLARKKVQSLK